MIDLTSDFGRKVKRHLKQESVIWLTTVGPDLTPQPRPVWFVWDGSTFLIFSRPRTAKVSQIRAQPRVALNFNTDAEQGDIDVIVFTGLAVIEPGASLAHQTPAYLKKYRTGIAGLKMTPAEYGQAYSVAIRVTPTGVRGW